MSLTRLPSCGFEADTRLEDGGGGGVGDRGLPGEVGDMSMSRSISSSRLFICGSGVGNDSNDESKLIVSLGRAVTGSGCTSAAKHYIYLVTACECRSKNY